MEMQNIAKALTSLATERVIFASNEQNCTVMDYLINRNIEFRTLLGKYKGTLETAYIIKTEDIDKIAYLLDGQESILSLSNVQKDNTREMQLIFANGDHDYIGMFDVLSSLFKTLTISKPLMPGNIISDRIRKGSSIAIFLTISSPEL